MFHNQVPKPALDSNMTTDDGPAVASVAFIKRLCECKCPLFTKKYLRPHRTNGSKVLRCFPHCCPQHTESPFCVSSLGVRVAGSVDFLQHCIVLLHFEASYERPIVCGDLMDEHAIEIALRTETNPRGEWIPTQVVAVEDDHVVYEYNAEAESGWNYRWLGGSSTQQRRCWHCIKAYVLTRVQRATGPSHLRVIAIVQSPPFVVMSYRRACKSCQKKSTADPVLSATSREACECEGMYRLSDSHLDEIISTGATRMTILPDLDAASPRVATMGDASDPAVMERHLGLLYAALTNCTINVTTDAALIQFGLQRCRACGISNAQSLPQPPDMNTRILLALLRGRATSEEFLRRHAHSILDQDELFRLYEQWIAQVYANVCAVVADTQTSVADFFESLAAAAAAAPTPSHASPEAAATISSNGFEAFVAQLREVYLALDYAAPKPLSPSAELDGWTASLLTVARSLSMGLGLSIVLSSTSLFVRSELALFSTIWSEFILDNTARVLQVFPNGESTMSTCADLMYGDYVGSRPQTNQVRLDLFCWPLEHTKHRTCYGIRLVFQAEASSRLHGQVEVQVAHNVVEQNTWNMTAAQRMDVLHRYELTTIARIAVGYTTAPSG
ncbi:hypothetical protein, variant 2 [Aphanomyces invadans]|uniref:Uncharacterized protein n=1 Tax=Aphanomyces invadans TaxID=157072 RepID=A0A024TP34_9STRA|nr:hypothetical protein, variant 2 [Aphanomyces invadans]ETV95122.1 hypothetical protein, variant 2 [Aphanomyces invadans]|eukprot:XP_008876293.1 hypothetical protein, variant 2 [Aphanomyces invadans]